ncbi:Arginase/deacetylase [Aspergillus sclerotioniger CBS 115572]|uniref:Arginase/deacetylase n=1 Tax=Aspergillus sclerotioniger CBS 115572 TaxID=1450535 RepID=A0A317V755_9EURO|nr:Arginase/deacetylase [Aspergillus sclerotioniger CBS 115572]PWY69855.1 Arginase/deacetylase [Aspergillus sclerotioniger CBS 115572]
MDPSKRPEPASFTAASTSPATDPSMSHPNDAPPSSHRLSYPSMHATPLPPSSSGFSSASLLSPSDPPRSKETLVHRVAAFQPGASTSPRPSLSRHSSSSTFGTSPTNASTAHHPNMPSKKPSLTAMTEHPVPTATSIASEYFQKELNWHQSAELQSQTLVLVHDACYGHRFSRPRASRAALNSIVERPERIQAGVLGISAAYVRLARRHAGGLFPPHPDLDPLQLPVPPFQIRKTARTLPLNSPSVTHVHGSRWMDDLKTMCDAAESRLALNGKELVRPRSAGKDSASPSAPAFHEGDLYLCSESLNAFEGALGGVSDGVDAVLGPGPTKRAFVCIRPPGHHCSAGHPSGFCWINNVHVGISYAAMTHGLTHAAILDFDLHHGDGSQEIAWEQNHKAVTAPRNAAAHRKTMVGYFSLHDINSYPCEMGESEKVRNASVCIDKAHGQSIWNVHLEPWKSDEEFWALYAAKYTVLIDKARAFLRMHTERLASTPNGPAPKAAIFISAGFDASEWEGAGMQRHQVNVPTDFYARFTADVVRMASEEGLGTDGRIISVLEGGYSNRALTSGILSHLSGLGGSQGTMNDVDDQQIDRLAAEMTDRLGLSDRAPEGQLVSQPVYNREWWSAAMLEELEALVDPPAAPVKPREKSAPTYFATTQSFSAKVSTGSYSSPEPEAPLPPPPPPPPVGWATAARELSKTTSCRPEELNAEASRLRRERQTAADNATATATTTMTTTTTTADSRMKLRTETVKRTAAHTSVPPPQQKSASATSARPASSAAVRKTGSSRSNTPRLSTSPKNTPPVPRAAESAGPETPNPSADSGPSDVDSLAAGVRKLHIKLKVPSPEENAAREKERERPSKAGSKTPKEPRRPAGRALSAGVHKPVSTGEVEVKEDRSIVTPAATSPPPAMERKPEGAANGWNCAGTDVAAAAMAMSPPLTPGDGPDGRPQSSLYSPPGMTLARDGLPVMMMPPADHEGEGGGSNG